MPSPRCPYAPLVPPHALHTHPPPPSPACYHHQPARHPHFAFNTAPTQAKERLLNRTPAKPLQQQQQQGAGPEGDSRGGGGPGPSFLGGVSSHALTDLGPPGADGAEPYSTLSAATPFATPAALMRGPRLFIESSNGTLTLDARHALLGSTSAPNSANASPDTKPRRQQPHAASTALAGLHAESNGVGPLAHAGSTADEAAGGQGQGHALPPLALQQQEHHHHQHRHQQHHHQHHQPQHRHRVGTGSQDGAEREGGSPTSSRGRPQQQQAHVGGAGAGGPRYTDPHAERAARWQHHLQQVLAHDQGREQGSGAAGSVSSAGGGLGPSPAGSVQPGAGEAPRPALGQQQPQQQQPGDAASHQHASLAMRGPAGDAAGAGPGEGLQPARQLGGWPSLGGWLGPGQDMVQAAPAPAASAAGGCDMEDLTIRTMLTEMIDEVVEGM